jgi:hypothetical protein
MPSSPDPVEAGPPVAFTPEERATWVRQSLFTALVCVLLAVVPAVIAVSRFVEDRQLSNGPRVEATVVDVLSVRDDAGRGSSRILSPGASSALVRFTADTGEVVQTTLRTTRRSFDSTVALTYDPADPQRVRSVYGAPQTWQVPAGIAGLPLLFAVGMLVQAGRVYWRRCRESKSTLEILEQHRRRNA